MAEVSGLQVDVETLVEFERGLDPRHPEQSKIPARILGYGEISTVFEIQVPAMQGLACKRLPVFASLDEVARYEAAYEAYNRLLSSEIGLRLPAHGHAAFLDDAGRPVFYIVQQQLPYPSIGNRAIHALDREGALLLVRRVLGELCRVWGYNRRQGRLQVAIDGQVSNWAIDGFDPERPHLDASTPLWYVDTSTPLFRVDGVEQLDPELFLRSAPAFLAWLLRLLFLKDVVDRYYDLRRVAIDLIANFHKEQRPDLVADLVQLANSFFADGAAGLAMAPITEHEVRAYYREDATIWRLYLSMRKVDRTIHTLRRRPYPYILPGAIKR